MSLHILRTALVGVPAICFLLELPVDKGRVKTLGANT